MSHDAFDVLILIARPAAGKSEVIDFLRNVPPDVRAHDFHVGPLHEIDDFPMLWAWFEEDDILQKMGRPRLHSTEDYEFKDELLWQVLIERISLDYGKWLRDKPDLHQTTTVLVEFSRGTPSGGYQAAFEHLSHDMLNRAAVLYIAVPFEESLRKNRRRFNPDRPDSILEHGLSDDKMERLYREDDFADFSAGDGQWLTARGVRVPYVVFDNEDDVTTGQPQRLSERLQARLGVLWELYRARE